MDRPKEVRQAIRTISSYLDQLEMDLEMERAARKRAELKVKAAQASRAPKPPAGDKERALAVLGISGQPTESQIRQAYREKAKVFHPDAEGGSAERFREITEALDLLVTRVY